MKSPGFFYRQLSQKEDIFKYTKYLKGRLPQFFLFEPRFFGLIGINIGYLIRPGLSFRPRI